MQKIIKDKLKEIKKNCSLFGIKKLYVFGSAVSGRFTPESDVDILLSFDDKLTFEEYTRNYFEFHNKLQKLFKRKVDIITEKMLSNPYFIESVEETKELIYEA